eukprot:15339279-Ditylum_brightwellii.AAC.2
MLLHNKAIITPNSPRSTTLAPPCVRYGKCYPESSKEECNDCDMHTTWKMKKFTSKRIAATVLCGVLQVAIPPKAQPH